MPRKVSPIGFASRLGVIPLLLLGAISTHAQSPSDSSAAPTVGPLGSQDKDVVVERNAQAISANAPNGRIPFPRMIRLKRLRYVAPEYPSTALYDGVSGYVVIDFLVNEKGEPTSLQVVDAQPAKIFDSAALEAVRKWRYETTPTSGEVPTRTTVRFQVPVPVAAKPGS